MNIIVGDNDIPAKIPRRAYAFAMGFYSKGKAFYGVIGDNMLGCAIQYNCLRLAIRQMIGDNPNFAALPANKNMCRLLLAPGQAPRLIAMEAQMMNILRP